MKRLSYIVLLAGFGLALLYAFIGLLLLNTYTTWPYQRLGFAGHYIIWAYMLILCFGNTLMLIHDMRWIVTDGEPQLLYRWDDHWCHRMTVYILKRKILLYLVMAIPMVYTILHLFTRGLYLLWDWLDDKFFDLRMCFGWY